MKLWKWYLVPVPVRHERREIFEGYLSSNFANEGIKIAAARVDFNGPKYSRGPICQRHLSPTPKSFAHVRSLVERKTNHAFALPLFSTLLDQERKRSRAIILGQSRVEPSRVELGSFAHLQTDWANGVKITGARRSLLTCLVRWARP